MTPDELRTRRHDLGMSQSQLAAALGITTGRLEHWEAGRNGIPPFLGLALEALARRPLPPVRPAKTPPKVDRLPMNALPSEDGERWRIIRDHPAYAVSNHGRVARREARGRFPAGSLLALQRYTPTTLVWIGAKKLSVSKLVAQAFLPSPSAPALHLRYRDDDPRNVCADNLYYSDQAMVYERGEHNPQSKLTEDDAQMILSLRGKRTADEIAANYSIKRRQVYRIWSGEAWTHLQRSTTEE